MSAPVLQLRRFYTVKEVQEIFRLPSSKVVYHHARQPDGKDPGGFLSPYVRRDAGRVLFWKEGIDRLANGAP